MPSHRQLGTASGQGPMPKAVQSWGQLGMGPNPGSAAHPSYVPRPQFLRPVPLCGVGMMLTAACTCWEHGGNGGWHCGEGSQVFPVASLRLVP